MGCWEKMSRRKGKSRVQTAGILQTCEYRLAFAAFLTSLLHADILPPLSILNMPHNSAFYQAHSAVLFCISRLLNSRSLPSASVRQWITEGVADGLGSSLCRGICQQSLSSVTGHKFAYAIWLDVGSIAAWKVEHSSIVFPRALCFLSFQSFLPLPLNLWTPLSPYVPLFFLSLALLFSLYRSPLHPSPLSLSEPSLTLLIPCSLLSVPLSLLREPHLQ